METVEWNNNSKDGCDDDEENEGQDDDKAEAMVFYELSGEVGDSWQLTTSLFSILSFYL